jgi:hypothetical protein
LPLVGAIYCARSVRGASKGARVGHVGVFGLAREIYVSRRFPSRGQCDRPMSESEVYLTSLAMRQIATLRPTFNGGVMMPTSAPRKS